MSKIDKYKNALDEIEEVCIQCDNNSNCLKCKFYNKCDGELNLILRLIRQAKEGEEDDN